MFVITYSFHTSFFFDFLFFSWTLPRVSRCGVITYPHLNTSRKRSFLGNSLTVVCYGCGLCPASAVSPVVSKSQVPPTPAALLNQGFAHAASGEYPFREPSFVSATLESRWVPALDPGSSRSGTQQAASDFVRLIFFLSLRSAFKMVPFLRSFVFF